MQPRDVVSLLGGFLCSRGVTGAPHRRTTTTPRAGCALPATLFGNGGAIPRRPSFRTNVAVVQNLASQRRTFPAVALVSSGEGETGGDDRRGEILGRHHSSCSQRHG